MWPRPFVIVLLPLDLRTFYSRQNKLLILFIFMKNKGLCLLVHSLLWSSHWNGRRYNSFGSKVLTCLGGHVQENILNSFQWLLQSYLSHYLLILTRNNHGQFTFYYFWREMIMLIFMENSKYLSVIKIYFFPSFMSVVFSSLSLDNHR